MSSLGLSGVVSLLRVTLALPLTVATLPIGSSTACCASDAGAAVELGAVGCACARTLGVPTTVQQATSKSANESRRCIGGDSRERDIRRRAGRPVQPRRAERGMNA